MAVIKKRKSVLKSTGKTVMTKKVTALPNVSLPTKKRKAATHLQDFTWMIYGDKKIGKTSITSCFDKSLIYSFEPGAKALEAFVVDIPNWETALAYTEQLCVSKHKYKNVIIDTGRIAYDRNMEYVCAGLNIKHPSDENDFGKAWHLVGKSFEMFHLNLTSNGIGMIVVAHEKVSTIELASGLKKMKMEPDLSPASLGFYHGLVDIIAHYHFIGSKRFLTIRGNEFEVAGCRMSKNFLTPKGERVFRIPMGDSEEEAYSNLKKAFNNKQEKTYEDAEQKAAPKNTLKRKSKNK